MSAARISSSASSTTTAKRSPTTRCAPSKIKGAEDACARMAAVVRKLLANSGVERSDIVRAGIATPGPMDIAKGMILRPGNLPGWWDFPIRDRVSHHIGMPVTFANDANAAAYGEFWSGAGKQYHSLVFLTLGTGVGGGIIVGDTLIEGEHSCGSECGHILINPARRCTDGFARQARLARKLLQRDGGRRSGARGAGQRDASLRSPSGALPAKKSRRN